MTNLNKNARLLNRPIVYIERECYEKMSYWAYLGGKEDREFTCFAASEYDEEDGDFYVSDCFLVKHTGSGAAVEADDDDMLDILEKMHEHGIDPAQGFSVWVHSHPGEGPSAVYLSNTDEKNIDRLLNSDYLISIVFDSIGKSTYCRLDTKTVLGHQISIDCDLEVEGVLSHKTMKELSKEFKEKSKGKPKIYKYRSSYSTKRGSARKGDDPKPDDSWPRWFGGYLGLDDTEEIIRDFDLEDDMTEQIESDIITAMEKDVERISQRVQTGFWTFEKGVDALEAMGISKGRCIEEIKDRLGLSGIVDEDLENSQENISIEIIDAKDRSKK